VRVFLIIKTKNNMKLMFTWIEAHKAIAEKLLSYRQNQHALIEILKKAEIDGFNDQSEAGVAVPLVEIDPFTFFSYIYKHGALRNKRTVRKICQLLEIDIDVKDICGIPTSDPRNVWYFPYAFDRRNNEIGRLWNFYEKFLVNGINDQDFDDILTIKSVGKSKLLDGMFRIKPYEFLCINGIVISYLKDKKKISPEYSNFTQLQSLQVKIQNELNFDFPQISYDAYLDKTYSHEPKFFRIGSKAGEDVESVLEEMIINNIVSIGWPELGDLEEIEPLNKTNIQKNILKRGYYEGNNNVASRKAGEILTFYNIEPFDYVLAAEGMTIKAIGLVESDNYLYVDELEFPHCRNVKWLKTNITDLAVDEGLRTSVWQYQDSSSIAQIRNYLYAGKGEGVGTDESIVGNIDPGKKELPDFPLNIILYGPPGTGKTYHTIDKSVEIINGTSGNHEQNKIAFDELKQKQRIFFVTFHSNYSYEEFMIGIKPDTENNQLIFRKNRGIFFNIVDKARAAYETARTSKEQPARYVLIIDEINRANISKVFGELITLLEDDKRLDADNELKITLSNGDEFGVPPNLYIIGTMNTADKSISLIDIALRRRFEFIGKYPNSNVLSNSKFSDRVPFLESINKNIYEKRKNADYLIGHAYFLKDQSLSDIIRNKVIPLLMEYFNGRIDEVESMFEGTGYEVTYNTINYQWAIISKLIADAVL